MKVLYLEGVKLMNGGSTNGGTGFTGGLVRRITEFMQGRYGSDQLLRALFVVWLSFTLISGVIGHFCRSPMPSMILMGVSLLSAVLMIMRALSKNTRKRIAENMKYLEIEGKVRRELHLFFSRIKDRKVSRYRKCPSCKTPVRVKNIKGAHTVHCPICGENFRIEIKF